MDEVVPRWLHNSVSKLYCLVRIQVKSDIFLIGKRVSVLAQQ